MSALRTIDLVPGDARDIAAVERVMGEAFDPHYGEAWNRAQSLGILALPGVWLTLARLDGEVAGFALARGIVDEAELLLLAVCPAARRAGIGTALVRGFIAEARSRGMQRLHLEVRAGNAATALYTAHGFAKTGERRQYYRGQTGQAFDAHSYSRAL